MYKVDQIFSTADTVELPILHLFDELWRIGLDRVQVGLGIRIRLYARIINYDEAFTYF